jgi:hypothetical protein
MTFAEAVAYAQAIRKRADGFWLNPAVTGPLGDKALEVVCAWHWRGIPGRRTAMRAELVTLAGREERIQSWLRKRMAKALETAEPVPPVFTHWLVGFLRNPVRPKSKAGRLGNSTRDEIISFTVGELVKAGLRRSRNDASPADSAVDAVAAAWKMDWRAVEKAAKRGDSLRRKK